MRIKHFKDKIPLKVKVIVFVILSIIVVIIAFNKVINNNKKYNIRKSTEIITQKKYIKKLNVKNNKLENEYKQAESLFRDKQYSSSIEEANRIINKDKRFYKAYNIKGIALCYSNNYREGMKNIDKSLELNSSYGYARFNKALAYELYGKYDEALLWYDKDLEIEKYVWSYYGKASIYGRRGDVPNTIKYLKIALNISPEIKSIIRNEKDFNPVRNSKEFQDLIN